MEAVLANYKGSGNCHNYIITMMEKLIDEDDEDCFLKLAGNNHVYTNVKLQDDDLIELVNVLAEDKVIKGLDLRYNNITDEGAEAIAFLLDHNTSITELNLMGNNITAEGAKIIADALHANKGLTRLKMTGNKIGKQGGMNFAQALQINNTLEYLDVGECDLEIDSVIALCTVLNYNTTMKGITLNRPVFWTPQDEPAVHMSDLIKRSKTLLELHAAKFNFSDFGADRIADSLMVNFTLKILDLSCNRITRDAVESLSCVLRENTNLEVLDLAYNRAQDDGAIAIATALANYNTKLKVLCLTHNEIKEAGICALAKALDTNMTLKIIYIWGNTLTTPACAAFGRLLETKRLDEVDTDVRQYVVDGVPYLAHVPHDCDYRRYRFTVPIYGSDVPKDKSYALF